MLSPAQPQPHGMRATGWWQTSDNAVLHMRGWTPGLTLLHIGHWTGLTLLPPHSPLPQISHDRIANVEKVLSEGDRIKVGHGGLFSGWLLFSLLLGVQVGAPGEGEVQPLGDRIKLRTQTCDGARATVVVCFAWHHCCCHR